MQQAFGLGYWAVGNAPRYATTCTARSSPRPAEMRLTENMGPDSRPDVGRGLVEVEFRQEGGRWSPCTGLGAQGSRSCTVQLDPCLAIAGIVLFVRANYGVTDLQVVYRDGTRTPRAFALSDLICHTDDFQTHISILPLDESFAGLRLRVQGCAEHWSTATGAWVQGRRHRGGYGIVDASVMRTGWMTYNTAWATTYALRWPEGGVEAFILREQTSSTESWGIVDIAIQRADGAVDCLTSNPSFTREHSIPTHGRTVTGVQVWEQPYHGIIDLSFVFSDGSRPPRAFADSVQHGETGGVRTWERTLPPRSQIIGFDARDQPHFGVIDFLIALGPDPLPDAPSDVSASSEPISPRRGDAGNDQWLVVDQEDGHIWLGRVLISGRPVLVERSVEHRGPPSPAGSDRDGDGEAQDAGAQGDSETALDGPVRNARARSRSGGACPPSPSGPM